MSGDLGAGVLSMMVRAPHGELTRQQNIPTTPARSRAAEGTWAAPAPGASLGMGIGKNRDRPRHGPMGVPGAAGLLPGLIQQDPWPGRARLWGTGDWPCCGINGAGAAGLEGLLWGALMWAGWGEAWGQECCPWWPELVVPLGMQSTATEEAAIHNYRIYSWKFLCLPFWDCTCLTNNCWDVGLQFPEMKYILIWKSNENTLICLTWQRLISINVLSHCLPMLNITSVCLKSLLA